MRKILLIIVAVLAVIYLWMFGIPFQGSTASHQSLAKTSIPASWPPRLGKAYPDLEFLDANGQVVRLSSFKGKVLVIEPIGMNCPACQAFAGGHKAGGFKGTRPQQNLGSIEEYFPRFADGLHLTDDRIVFVQLLLYDMKLAQPTVKDAKDWTNHFDYPGKNRVVLIGKVDLRGNASYNLIPGFQLVDRKFILRSDSTGHHPKHGLYNHLLPMVPTLL